MIHSASDGSGPTIYKAQSWEGHCEMTALRDLVDSEEDNMHFGKSLPVTMGLDAITNRSTMYILFLWNEFAETFSFKMIDYNKFDEKPHSS